MVANKIPNLMEWVRFLHPLPFYKQGDMMYSLNVCDHGINMKDKCEKCGREAYR